VPDPVTVIQDVLVDEDHVQPAWVTTLNVPVTPAAAGVKDNGLTTNVHGPDCVTVKVLVAIVRSALRAPVVFVAILKLTVPLAERLDPAVTVIQLAPLVAVHAQPDVVVTATDPVPPVPAKAWLDGEMLNAQPAADCVTVKLLPAIVSVAVRAVAVVFAAAVKVTVPLPVPLDPTVTVTQPAPLVAVQAQPDIVVTATLPVPPAAAMACVDGEMLNVQLAPDCVTVKVWPEIVNVVLRAAVVVFAAAVKVTVPLPVSLDPAVTVTQLAPLVAVHAQPVVVVTATLPVPPAAPNACDDGEMLNAQPAAACVTVKLWPAIVSVAVRATVVAFAATLKLTVPLAEPLDPAVTVTQLAPLVAVHAQPVVVVTATLPVPPLAANACVDGEMLDEQLAPGCVTVKV
jgi:hypothetical protein